MFGAEGEELKRWRNQNAFNYGAELQQQIDERAKKTYKPQPTFVDDNSQQGPYSARSRDVNKYNYEIPNQPLTPRFDSETSRQNKIITNAPAISTNYDSAIQQLKYQIDRITNVEIPSKFKQTED